MRGSRIPILTWHRTVVLLFVLIEAALISGFGYATGKAEGLRAAVEQQPASSRALAVQCTGKANLTACFSENASKLSEARRAEAGLVAQQGATRWAWWSALLAGLQIPVSLAGILAVVQSLRQAREALDQSKRHGDLDLRPWIKVSAEPKVGSIESGVVSFDVDVKVENVGRSVAKNSLVGFKIILLDSTNIDRMIADLRMAVHQDKPANFDDSIPVLPTDTEMVTIGVRLPVSNLTYIVHPNLGPIAAPSLAIWCDYKWGEDQQGRSLRLYQIGVMRSGQRFAGLPAVLPAKDVKFLLKPQYGSFAD